MRADVKVRGVIVGQVNKAESEGEGATLTLGIKPDEIDSIPKNVTAALVPKTLFGEKYVELNIPKDASSSSLEAGDKIEQTELPIEVERVLNDLYPLLRTVQPAETQLHAECAGHRPRRPWRQARRELRDAGQLPEAVEPPDPGHHRRHQAARDRSPTPTPT